MSTEPAVRAAPGRAGALRDAGARIEVIDTAGEQSPASAVPLPPAFGRLADAGVTSVIVEGGAALHQALWTAGLVDRVQMFVSPRLAGPSGVPWIPCETFRVSRLAEPTAVAMGDDVLIEGYVHRID